MHKPKTLVKIGVLILVQQSQYGTPVFIIPKKEGTVRVIIHYCRLNQNLARKPYLIPIIGEIMQQLERFQYMTSLDLNVGYYTIRLSPAIQDMMTIVNEFWKFRYNCLSMGMRASGDILPAKLYELIGDINIVKTYTDDILVLSKYCFRNYINS